ncbi:FAD-dependent oxidoreductase [Pseudonocardia sp. MCCB 268]|nr:FAD-dependent oxidoreductase [Pseudonocardia cytotoxica]
MLEARDRLGGRVWTDRRLGRDLEIGGTWLHWTQPHVWAEIARLAWTSPGGRGETATETNMDWSVSARWTSSWS